MTIRKYIAQSALVLAIPFSVNAGDAGTVYTQLSSNGWGIGYAKSIAPEWAVRGQYNFMQLSSPAFYMTELGIQDLSQVQINLSSLVAMADWYPSTGGFRLTGGLAINNSNITANVSKVNNKQANGSLEVKMSDFISPYIGLGYSIRPQNLKGVGFVFDYGVMFQNPQVKLNITDTNVTAADIAAEQAKIQDSINNHYKYKTVLGAGIVFEF